MPIILPSSEVKRDHLVIPDDHAHPDDNFRRYEWLGNYIIEKQPEVIIKLGDSWDMASLCSYDKGKKSAVFRNVEEDLEAGHESERILYKPMMDYNATRSRWKKKQYNPTIIKILGNHEYRVKRLLEYEPQWEGMIGMDSFHNRLGLKETVIDFLDFIVLDNVAYSHYFVSGTMARPFSSARAMLGKRAMSCTMGHNHGLDFALQPKPTGELIRGLIAGSFHDPEHASFAGPQVDNIWWNGIIHKHDVLNGNYDMEEIHVNRLGAMYG